MKKPYLRYIALVLTATLLSCTRSAKQATVQKKEVQAWIDSLEHTDLSRKDRIQSIRNRGYSFYFNGDINSAQILFERGYQWDSTELENQYAMGLVKTIHGDYTGALAQFDKIIARDSLAQLAVYGSKALIHAFQGEDEKAGSLVQELLQSPQDTLRREAYSIAAALAMEKGKMAEAVCLMKLRVPLSQKLYAKYAPRLEHPYWDYHLIGNMFLAAQQPDSAKVYVDQGMALVDPDDHPKTIRVIRGDYNYFKSMYLLGKGKYEDSQANFKTDFENNQNGYGGIWARILIATNLPDSALTVLDTYSRPGYYKMFLSAMAHQKANRHKKAKQLYTEVLDFHQVGEWYWQHEYALICSETRNRLKSLEGESSTDSDVTSR